MNHLKLFFSNDEKKDKVYELFNYEPKYIRLINEENKSIEDIEADIVDEMKQHSKKIGIDFSIYIFNIFSNINREKNYEILTLKTISMKFCILELKPTFFRIYYKSKFIQNIVEDQMKKIDTKNYFEFKRYNDNDLYSSLKGQFFEYASNQNLNKIIQDLFNVSIKYCLKVENIIGMKQCGNKDDLQIIIQNFKNIKDSIKQITMKKLYVKNIKLINNRLKDNEIFNYTNENKTIKQEIKNINKIGSKIDDNKKDINYYFSKDLQEEIIKINNLLGKKRSIEIEEKSVKKTKCSRHFNPPQTKTNKTKESKGNTKKNKPSISHNIIKKTIQSNVDDFLNNITNYIEYNEEFKNGPILISQRQFSGEALDLGVLLGDKDNKKFIGFQMKFYDKNTHLKEPITKDSIKEKIHPILINCLKNFGINIVEWHYIMCLYYNNTDENEYNEHLVRNCKNHDIQYIFFNPIENKFYDRNKEVLNKIDLNFLTNIDYNSNINPFNIFKDHDLAEEYLNQVNDKSIVNISNEIFDENADEIQKKIKNAIKENVQAICRFKLIKEADFPIPSNLNLFLFKNGKLFICYYKKNNKSFSKPLDSFISIYPSEIELYLEDKKRKKNENEDIFFYVFKINMA